MTQYDAATVHPLAPDDLVPERRDYEEQSTSASRGTGDPSPEDLVAQAATKATLSSSLARGALVQAKRQVLTGRSDRSAQADGEDEIPAV